MIISLRLRRALEGSDRERMDVFRSPDLQEHSRQARNDKGVESERKEDSPETMSGIRVEARINGRREMTNSTKHRLNDDEGVSCSFAFL